jgi:phosphoribosylanthranilate isomerase
MLATRRPRVKVCCIASIEEAEMAVAAGASALGLVSSMPSGPGVIPDEEIARIAAATPPGVSRFLLTSRTEVEAIADQQRRTGVDTLQIVDSLAPGALTTLRAALPGVRVVQVVHVTGEESVGEALAAAPHVHAVLLDSGNPRAAVKELGGTGRRHDWSLSRRIREALPVPTFLAGGLTAGNAAEAIESVGPWALDVCSGVRSEGRLDPRKLDAFFDAVG